MQKNYRYCQNDSRSTHERLLLLIVCYKWNKCLCSFRIECIGKLGTSYYHSVVLCNFHMQQKWEGANWEVLSLKHHIVNKHIFPQNTYYKKCNHPPLSTEQSQRKKWLEMGFAAHEKLVKIISEKMLVADLEHMTKQVNATLPEVFHAKIISYLPKSTFF